MPTENQSAVNKYYSRELIIKAQQGDSEAIETLVKNNQPLVISTVKRFLYLSESMEDIVQIGNIGLIKAIKRFDLNFNTQFSTYAVYLISGEVKKYFRDNGYIKTGRKLKELYLKARSFKYEFLKLNGYSPGINEIAEGINESPETITQAMQACGSPEYFEAAAYQTDKGEKTLKDTIKADSGEADEGLDIIDLKNALLSLNGEERQIIVLRFIKNYTQAQTGKLLNRSQVQISRAEKKILQKIKLKITIDE